MNTTKANSEVIGRRAELLAELFLQDLEPEFVARPTEHFGFDFFAGFPNPRGGINYVAVELEGTEQSTGGSFAIPRSKYVRWANSDIPFLLLVVNVKENDCFFAWPAPELTEDDRHSKFVRVPLTEVDNESRAKLRERLAASNH